MYLLHFQILSKRAEACRGFAQVGEVTRRASGIYAVALTFLDSHLNAITHSLPGEIMDGCWNPHEDEGQLVAHDGEEGHELLDGVFEKYDELVVPPFESMALPVPVQVTDSRAFQLV